MAQIHTADKNDRNDQADTDAVTEDVDGEFDILTSALAITSTEDEGIMEEITIV
ncbi:hypothetical protein [Haladaptatus halobius]|uniref:hypothetical protein n=1 Tax=Haladaptatus halobius TaxID=2884875 RepID=UPI001D0BB4B6|nr:hypothetical protein [Haladaptatus halobius]